MTCWDDDDLQDEVERELDDFTKAHDAAHPVIHFLEI